MSAPDAPRRLSLSQIVEMLLTRAGGERSAVTIARTAAGDTTLDVKVRTGDDGDTQTVEQAAAKAQEVYDRLAELYPARDRDAGGEVSLTRNAKGETQVAVQVKTNEEAPTVADAGEHAQLEYDRLRSAYPMANGLSAKPGSVK